MAEMTNNAAHKLSMKLAAAVDAEATDTSEFEANLLKYDGWHKRLASQAVDTYAHRNPRMGKHARKIKPCLERLTQRSVPEGEAALAQAAQVPAEERVARPVRDESGMKTGISTSTLEAAQICEGAKEPQGWNDQSGTHPSQSIW